MRINIEVYDEVLELSKRTLAGKAIWMIEEKATIIFMSNKETQMKELITPPTMINIESRGINLRGNEGEMR